MKYKICVYAISKNEEEFVERWTSSIKEADYICVLDTGSTDNTVKLLKEKGVNVIEKEIKPWRFDVARNESLKLIPEDTDICICLDLDEIMLPGWRKELEKIWQKDTNRCRYIFNWKLDDENKPIISYRGEKIHSKNDYIWIYPVHEVLKYNKEKENIILTDKITINHYPKPKDSRTSYLDLLELAVKEVPENDRNMHYLGREYMYYHRWNDAIDTLIKHLSLPNSIWKDERCASMRFIARCYQNLNRYEEAKMWLEKAIEEAPYLRDSYVELALLEYSQNNLAKTEEACLLALNIPKNTLSYINEPYTFDETVYDLLSISYFYQGKIKKSLEMINKALEINPHNERIINNKNIILKSKKE